MGALNLCRRRRGRLDDLALTGGLLAAELASLPLLDLLAAQDGHATGQSGDALQGQDGQQEDGWMQLASLDRVEVYQATGMLMAALGVDQTEALVRLRAHAYARGRTAAQVAAAIVGRRVSLTSSDWRDEGALPPGGGR